MLLILTSNHFDLTWRRPWKRPLYDQGRRFASYADIEEWYMLDNLALARKVPDYAFELECSAQAREFLKRHPELQGELRKLTAEGRFMVTGGGDNIIDSNLVLGESIVRNFVRGLTWAERELGCKPKLAVRTDAFGNSAQVPQILRRCELAWVKGFAYSPNLQPYWRGVDGSVVCSSEPMSAKLPADLYHKHLPCPSCAGEGCIDCDQRGIELERARVPVAELDHSAIEHQEVCQYMINPEELLPNPEIIDRVRQWRESLEVRFAISDDQYPFVASLLQRVDAPPEEQVHPGVELNPNNSGTWVTRIKTKQECRRQEYALLAAEAAVALASLTGQSIPRNKLMATWNELLFTMFHDAITATLVDAAYDELEETWASIDGEIRSLRHSTIGPVSIAEDTVLVWNPTGFPATEIVTARVATTGDERLDLTHPQGAVHLLKVEPQDTATANVHFVAREIPPYSVEKYRIRRTPAHSSPQTHESNRNPSAALGETQLGASGSTTSHSASRVDAATREDIARSTRIENEFYSVEAGTHGIERITDKRLGRTVARAADYQVGELVFEQDLGSPWATLSPDRVRQGSCQRMRLLRSETTAPQQRLVFSLNVQRIAKGCMQAHLTGEVAVVLTATIPRVEFEYRLYWDSYNTRVRAAFPIPFTGKAVYGVPYAALVRESYEPSYGWAGANGDWPASEWAAIEGPGASVAVLNRGTPSYCVEQAAEARGSIAFVSLLRSPTVPTYLHDPHDYSMTQYDGMRDAGRHEFSLALTSDAGPVLQSRIMHRAVTYNARLWASPDLARLSEAPSLESDVGYISAIKVAEDNDDLVLRIVEYRGRGGPARLILPPALRRAEVRKTNLLERAGTPLHNDGGVVELELSPWEIGTIRVAA